MVAHLLHKYRWIGWIGLLIITYVALDMIWRGSQEVLQHTTGLM
jgi:predicted tellurium resistance membrane protein TerC